MIIDACKRLGHPTCLLVRNFCDKLFYLLFLMYNPHEYVEKICYRY